MHTIDCNGIQDKKQLHTLLARSLSFPDYYGHNLDALYDCLTEIGDPTTVQLTGWDSLDSWKAGFMSVFEAAAQDNPNLQFIFA